MISMSYVNPSAMDFSTSYFFNDTPIIQESLSDLYQEAVTESIFTKAWYAFRSVVLNISMKVINTRMDKVKKRFENVLDDNKVVLKGKTFHAEGKEFNGVIISTPEQLATRMVAVTNDMIALLALVDQHDTDISKYDKINETYQDKGLHKHIKGLTLKIKSDEDLTMTKQEAINAVKAMELSHKQISSKLMNGIIRVLRNKSYNTTDDKGVSQTTTADEVFGWTNDAKLTKSIKQAMDSILKVYMLTMTSYLRYFNAFKEASIT